MNKICPVCNTVFSGKRTYCSTECQHKSMRTYNYDVNNPPHCKFCNKLLSHQQANSGGIFCSFDCRNSYLKQTQKNYIKSVDPTTTVCCICGKCLTYDQIKRNIKTCSAKCSYELRVQLYGAVSEANPNKHVQYAIINSLRHDENLLEKQRKTMKRNWEKEDFRKKVITRMTTNNPVYMEGVVQKTNNTKEQKGILHTWCGIRGGNGRLSPCEQLLYDFCIDNGFVYNKAINTYSLRKQYPEKHLAFNYKPDFTNFQYKLCIEVDGDSHKSVTGRLEDEKKEFCLNCLGYTVIRFTNNMIKNNIEAVKNAILKSLQELKCNNGQTNI